MSCVTTQSAMPQASLVKQLSCKLEQKQNVNPQRRHKMPIPTGNVHDDAARQDGPVQQRKESSSEQRQNAAHEMNGVSASQQIDERTAWGCGDIKATRRELLPRHPLPEQKQKSKSDGHGQPWSLPFHASGSARCGLRRSG